MAQQDFKTFSVKPMVGVFDTLSSADEVGFGNWRVVKDAVTRSTRNRQRGGGWRRLFAQDLTYNNQDLHDQLTDRLSFFDSYVGHAMGGGGVSGYEYPYFVPSTVIPEFDTFPNLSGPYCDIYYPEYNGLYLGCPIVYPFVGFPYVQVSDSVPTTGLVSHWRFDEVSGPRADVVGGNTLTSIAVGSQSGLMGRAASFVAPHGHYLEGAGPPFAPGDTRFGITGWVYRYSTDLGSRVESLFRKGSVAGLNMEFELYIALNALYFHVSSTGVKDKTVSTVDNVFHPTGAGPGHVPAGRWVFFAAWHDPVANTINVKINDEPTTSKSHTTGVFAGANGITLGLSGDPLEATLDAALDSVSFWKNGFPSESELSMLYHGGMGLDYPFNLSACVTDPPGSYIQSFVYVSCPLHHESEIVPGYGYGPAFPVYSSEFSYDYIYCGTDLHYRTGCREAVTMLGEIVTSTGRKLIAGTMSRVYEYNQSAGNWRILADGLGNVGYTASQCGCNSVRGTMATMGLYMLYTNNFDYPSIYLLGEMQENCQGKDLVPIADLVALGITRSGGVVVWKGFVIFFDITEGGTRMGGTFIWSDLETPYSFIESDVSLAGRISVSVGQTILAMAPLGNWLMCYTDKGIYRITLVGGEDIFNVEEIKGVGGNALKFKYSLMVTGSAHLWLSDSDVMYFSQFDVAPMHVPWITRASGMIFNGISETDAEYGPVNREACDLVTGGWNDETREAWLSYPSGDNICPNVTIRFNLKFNAADFTDHGFTSMLTFRADLRPTVGQWMEDMGICPRASLVAMGPKDGPSCSAQQDAVANAPLYIRNPQESEDFPVHPDSLCARLVGKSIDDYCVDCSAPPTYIVASATDFALKQAEDNYYYREILAGNIYDYDAYSCSGQFYTQVGYDTVMQTGADDFRTDDEKITKMTGFEAEPLPQSTPSTLQMEVGYGSQSRCLTWVPIRSLPFECHVAAPGLRSDFTFYFPTWRRGRYLGSRFRIGGIGGGGTFTGLERMIKHWGQQDSP